MEIFSFFFFLMSEKSVIKLLLIGDSGAGKSSLLLSYTEQRFLPPEEAAATVGVDFRLVRKEFNQNQYKVCIWDTAGQERFRTLTSSFYRGAAVVFLVFDVSNRDTFESLNSWFDEVKLYCTDFEVVTCVVANKMDTPMMERQVSPQEGMDFAKSKDSNYREVSAKTMEGVSELFDEFSKM
ncbi:hypothetical protein HMI55_000440, partial [Coelomomyces lativittatus]